MTVIVDAPCLSAIVSGMRDEGGKGRPNKNPSVCVASVTIQDSSATCGEVHTRTYEQPFRSPFQGESLLDPNPGLKPWAILLCHFVAIAYRRVAHSPHSPPLTTKCQGIERK